MEELYDFFVKSDTDMMFLMSFMMGILFSGISYGIIYVIIFIIVGEFFHYGYLDCNLMNYRYGDRFLICLGGLLGYLLGASFLHEDDDYCQQVSEFGDDLCWAGRACGWFDTKSYRRYLQKQKKTECIYHHANHEPSTKKCHLKCKKECIYPPGCPLYQGKGCRYHK